MGKIFEIVMCKIRMKRSALVSRFEEKGLGSNVGGFEETSFGEEVT